MPRGRAGPLVRSVGHGALVPGQCASGVAGVGRILPVPPEMGSQPTDGWGQADDESRETASDCAEPMARAGRHRELGRRSHLQRLFRLLLDPELVECFDVAVDAVLQ